MPETWLFPRTAVPGGVWSVSQVTHATGPRGGASSLLAARVCHSHLCPLRPTGSVPLLPATATATPLPPATTAVTPVPPCSSACALGAPPFSPAFSPVHFPPLQPGLMPRQPLSWRTVPALAFHHRCLTKPHPPPSQVPPTADGEGSRAVGSWHDFKASRCAGALHGSRSTLSHHRQQLFLGLTCHRRPLPLSA